MDKQELKQLLTDARIQKNSYSLNGGLPNEALCLNKEGDIWEIYYSERGMKSQLVYFHTEDEACNYFYKTALELCEGYNDHNG